MAASTVAAASTGSDLTVLLHPLVIINISDHATRLRVANKRDTRVYGALFGTRQGRSIEVHTSFELVTTGDGADVRVRMDYLDEKAKRYAEVFKEYSVLGWYSTGAGLQPGDDDVHRQLLSVNPNAIYLVVDTSVDASATTAATTTGTGSAQTQQLIRVYESVSSSLGNLDDFKFREVPYKLEVVESERIALDHVTRFARGGHETTRSSVVQQASSMHNAVSLLHSRLRVIVDFLQAVRSGTITPSHSLMRRIASLWYRLPKGDASELVDALSQEYSDALLIAYLSTLTKGVTELSELVDTFVSTQEPRTGGGGSGMRDPFTMSRSSKRMGLAGPSSSGVLTFDR